MEKMETFFILLLVTCYSSFDCQRFTKQMQNKVGIVMRHYPKRYIVPKRWIRKLFGMNSQPIPKYLYFELFVSIIYALLGSIYIILAACFGTKVAAALQGHDLLLQPVWCWILGSQPDAHRPFL